MTAPAQPSDFGPRRELRVRYWPAFDGLRGIAIMLVVMYHAVLFAHPTSSELKHGLNPPASIVWWVLRHGQEGLIGVDVFFVLSGFLITALLLSERAETGRTSFRTFYTRRARRLLPALVLLVVLGAIYVALKPSSPAAHGYWSDAAATLFYVMNWVQASHQVFQAHLLSHAWSLSIEEQFYLLWPLTLVALLGRAGNKRVRAAVVVGVLAVGSAGLRYVAWRQGVSVTRIYYGLDTRADALLIGCLVALVLFAGLLPTSRALDRLVQVGGWLGLVILGAITMRTLGQINSLIEGLYTVVALATAAIILAVIKQSAGLLNRVLSFRPLTSIGKVSYGLYLWHFPIFLVLTRARTGLGFLPNLLLQLTVMAAITVTSYFLVEKRFLRSRDRFRPRRHGTVSANLTGG